MAPFPEPYSAVAPGKVIQAASVPYCQAQPAATATVMVLTVVASAAMTMLWPAAGVKVYEHCANAGSAAASSRSSFMIVMLALPGRL